eukprot:52045_1
MDDDARILREFQRLSVGAFDDSFKHSLAEEHYQNKPTNTFHALQADNTSHLKPNSHAKEKYFNYIHNDQDDKHYDTESNECSDGFSIDYIINDLKRRKENRLRKEHRNGTSYRNEHKYPSRFMLAANKQRRSKHDRMDNEYNEIINRKSNEIESLHTQLEEKEQIIESLQNKLAEEKHSNISRSNGHRRHKSMTQTHTEQSTIESVRWSLRSEISKMTAAENEVNRLLQSVGDTSMIHDRLKKIHDTISVHKRKVSALEQSLHMDAFQSLSIVPADQSTDIYPFNPLMADEKKDFELLSKQYCKLKIEFAELKQEQQQWNNTKEELENVNKRCHNLMNMLDKLSDEKLQLTLQIEDLNAFLNKNNLVYDQ